MKILPESKIRLRRLQETDLRITMQWRMSTEVTNYLFTDPALTMDEQMKWFMEIEKDKNSKYWIIEIDGIKIGVFALVEIDYKNKKCNRIWHIGESTYKGKGIGTSLQLNCNNYVFNDMGLNRLYCEVFSFNDMGIRACLKGGLLVEGEMKEAVYKNGKFWDVTLMGITASKWAEIKKQYSYSKIEFED